MPSRDAVKHHLSPRAFLTKVAALRSPAVALEPAPCGVDICVIAYASVGGVSPRLDVKSERRGEAAAFRCSIDPSAHDRERLPTIATP